MPFSTSSFRRRGEPRQALASVGRMGGDATSSIRSQRTLSRDDLSALRDDLRSSGSGGLSEMGSRRLSANQMGPGAFRSRGEMSRFAGGNQIGGAMQYGMSGSEDFSGPVAGVRRASSAQENPPSSRRSWSEPDFDPRSLRGDEARAYRRELGAARHSQHLQDRDRRLAEREAYFNELAMMRDKPAMSRMESRR